MPAVIWFVIQGPLVWVEEDNILPNPDKKENRGEICRKEQV
jgi:hypothetical protein